MSATLTTFDKVLKDFYVDKVPEAINQKIALKEHFKKRSDMKVDGRDVKYPIHVGRNTGVGAVGEGATLPVAGNQQYTDLTVPFRYNYGRIQITSQAMKQSMTSKGAFRKAVDEEIKRAGNDVGRELNRQLWGFGRGDLCAASGSPGAGTSVTVTVKDPMGVSGTVNPARFVRVGDIIAFVTSGTLNCVGTVTAVASNLSTITVAFASSQTVADGDIIVRCSNTSATSLNDTAYSKEVMGMLGHVDDGTYTSTYHGLVRATYPAFKSYRSTINNSLSLGAIQKCFDAADQLGNGNIKVLWGHHSVRAEYLNLLQSYRRYIDAKSLTPDGGFKGAALSADISYAETPFKVDRDCPYSVLFGIDDTGMNRYVVSEGEWADDDGRILNRVVNQDSYEARFRVFDNYCNDTPNACFVMDGITLSEDPAAIQLV